MAQITFYISDNDHDRLDAIKELQGKQDMSGNEFAKELLQAELNRLFPVIPEYDEQGKLINAEQYKGGLPF